MPIKDSTLVVSLPVFGREVTTVKSWSIDSDYLKSTDGFEFVLWPFDTDGVRLGVGDRRLELQPVELFVNGAKQLVGRIDVTDVGDNGLAIRCQGRDFMADLVECNVDPTFKAKAGMTLQDVIFTVGAPVGVDAIVDDDEISMEDIRSGVKVGKRGSGKRKKKEKIQDFNPKPGEGVYEYLNRLVARHSSTMQPGNDRGTIVLSSPRYDQDSRYTLRRSAEQTQGARNNVKSSTARRDYSRLPTFALFNGFQAKGGKSGSGVSNTLDITELASRSPELAAVIGNGTAAGRIKPEDGNDNLGAGRLYRLLHFRDDDARTTEELESAARRAVAERFKDTLEYTAVVRGHTDERTGAIYTINTMIDVQDEIAGVFEQLWIYQRTLQFSDTDGATTTIKALRPHSFEL